MKAPVPLLSLGMLAALEKLALAKGGPRLEYFQGPAECLDEMNFRREVAIARDGADPFSSDSAELLRVSFSQDGAAYRGTYEYVNASGDVEESKSLSYPSCEVLGRMVGISVRDLVLPPPSAPPASSAPPAPPAPAPAPPAPSPPFTAPAALLPVAPLSLQHNQRVAPTSAKKQDPPVDVTVETNAAIVMSVGLTANPTPGFAIGAAVRRSWFSFGVEVRGLPPSGIYFKDKIPGYDHNRPPYWADASRWTGALVPCVHVSYFVGCGVMEFGVFVVKRPFTVGPPIFTDTVVTVGPRAGLELPFGERFALSVYGEVNVNITQPTFSEYGENPAAPNLSWSEPVVFGMAGVALKVSFK